MPPPSYFANSNLFLMTEPSAWAVLFFEDQVLAEGIVVSLPIF